MVLAISRALCLLLLSLALCQAVSGTLTSDIQLVLKQITKQSEDLRISTLQVTIHNAYLEGRNIPVGFAGISSNLSQAADQIWRSEEEPLSDDDAKLVVGSLTTFVQVQQALLSVVIDKHGLPTLAPYFTQIRQSLWNLGGHATFYSYALFSKIPTQIGAAKKQFDALDTSVREASRSYSDSHELRAPE